MGVGELMSKHTIPHGLKLHSVNNDVVLSREPSTGLQMESDKEFATAIRARRHRARQAVRDFAIAVHTADSKLLRDRLHAIDLLCLWKATMRAVRKSPCPSDAFRSKLMQFWIEHGDHIRSEVGDDLLLADGLRAMLPAYAGPAVMLYRGDSFENRRRRLYGLSWSRNVDVAREYAKNGFWRNSKVAACCLKP
jgi:hypothetical protein